MGYVPQPDIEAGQHLVDALFKIGPAHAEAALNEGDLEPYERRRGIQFEPWQAELIVEMSKAYLHEAHDARKINAEPPFEEAKAMWRWVRNAKAEKQWDKVRPQTKGASTTWPSSAISKSA